MTLQGHVQRGQEPLGRVIVEDDPLVDHDRLSGDARGLGVQSEIDDQLLGRQTESRLLCFASRGHAESPTRRTAPRRGASWTRSITRRDPRRQIGRDHDGIHAVGRADDGDAQWLD